MLFGSYQFLIFFVVVFISYWALPWQRGRVLLLLAGSIYFYACWNHWLAAILCISSIADYLIARGMEATSSAPLRKSLLLVSLVGNIGMLCYFKYANFFLHSLQETAGAVGFTVAMPVLEVILPVGISFYTFEAINYTVDVYRGTVRATRDVTQFLLFILFFPHLIAGPIVRARAFLPLIARRKRWSWLRAHTGVQLFLLGAVKKYAIADRMAAYVDPVFADPAVFATFTLVLAAVAYTIQLYCDFSGYSDMALGLAHLFGYHLAINFNMPFLAPNVSEFWRRWHISLSSWIRDYVFIPLGGSAGSRLLTYRNLLVTFTLCGLWHGAGWNYVAFGFVTGIFLVIHAMFREWCKSYPALQAMLLTRAGTCLRIAVTFSCFCLSTIVFRCQDLSLAGTMLRRIALPVDGAGFAVETKWLFITFGVVLAGHVLGQGNRGVSWWESLPSPIRGVGYGLGVAAALVLAPGASVAFIYFQF